MIRAIKLKRKIGFANGNISPNIDRDNIEYYSEQVSRACNIIKGKYNEMEILVGRHLVLTMMTGECDVKALSLNTPDNVHIIRSLVSSVTNKTNSKVKKVADMLLEYCGPLLIDTYRVASAVIHLSIGQYVYKRGMLDFITDDNTKEELPSSLEGTVNINSVLKHFDNTKWLDGCDEINILAKDVLILTIAGVSPAVINDELGDDDITVQLNAFAFLIENRSKIQEEYIKTELSNFISNNKDSGTIDMAINYLEREIILS